MITSTATVQSDSFLLSLIPPRPLISMKLHVPPKVPPMRSHDARRLANARYNAGPQFTARELRQMERENELERRMYEAREKDAGKVDG